MLNININIPTTKKNLTCSNNVDFFRSCNAHQPPWRDKVDHTLSFIRNRVRPSLHQQDLIVQGVKCVIHMVWSVYCTSVPCVVQCAYCIVQCVQCVLHRVFSVYLTSNYSSNKEDFDIKSNYIYIYYIIFKKKPTQSNIKTSTIFFCNTHSLQRILYTH